MTSWWANARDTIRSQLWPIPAIAVVAALAVGLGLPQVDARVDGHISGWLSDWGFGGDADAARALLEAIASSLITVTALTFSLTVVTLQLASSQFSPRLLRTFTSDRFVQATLALFLATFTYALTLLRAVRGSSDGSGQGEVVPQLAITLAFVLAVASVLGLVLFLGHLAQQIRVETMLRSVHRDASGMMRAVLPERDRAEPDHRAGPQAPPGALELLAPADGFLTWIAHSELLTVAVDEDAVVRVEVYPGSYVVKGTPVGLAWPASGGRFDAETADRVADAAAGCLHTGFEPTASQDVGYGLRQLTDVATKALSPGINDPTTAIHALGHISALLCELAGHELGARILRDEDDRVRVRMEGPDLASLIDRGISQPRRYGAADPLVLERIFEVLLDLSHRVAPDQRQAVRDHLERLRGTAAAQDLDLHERGSLAELGLRVEANLGMRPTETRTREA